MVHYYVNTLETFFFSCLQLLKIRRKTLHLLLKEGNSLLPDYGLCPLRTRTLEKEEKLQNKNEIKACDFPERFLLILSFLYFLIEKFKDRK